MAKATVVGCGLAVLFGAAELALAQGRSPIRGIPVGGGDSSGSFSEAIPLLILTFGLIALSGALVIGLVQLLYHGGFHLLVSSIVGMATAYEWVSRLLPAPRIDHRRIELERQLEQVLLAEGRSRVREILRQRLPQFNAEQNEGLLDALKFTGYLRLPNGVLLRDYDPRRLSIDLDASAPTFTRVNMLYDGKLFIQISVAPGDRISTAE